SAPGQMTERLLEANRGGPVDVVFEMAGGKVFEQSLAALAPFGRLVTYGIASREGNTVRSAALMRRSRAVVGFWLMHCLGRPAMIEEALADLFARVARGELRVVTGPAYPLERAAQAQADLAERRTTGKVTLDPTAGEAPAGAAAAREDGFIPGDGSGNLGAGRRAEAGPRGLRSPRRQA
ncbi:MAG: zinc-binding dehydrogenase, partial [Actinomycetota bacterium]|nr:zinc-binding dehydrogenase [Actinomycetota bacterium]